MVDAPSGMKCNAKHTLYQPKDEEWACPYCGASQQDGTGLVIEEPDETSDEACELLHVHDYLFCYTCRKGITGKAFAARLQKINNLVTCPCCKGKGLVNPWKETK